MTDERVYEVEKRSGSAALWRFVCNLEVTDHAMLEAFTQRAEQEDWADGEYRLLHWDQDFASGSFFLVTLRSERQRRASMERPEATIPETKYGRAHDDGSACMEPAWCRRHHVKTPEVAA